MRLLLIFIFCLTSNLVYAEKPKCSPTPKMLLGTNFTKIINKKTNISTGIKISGKILSAVDCKPITNVKISHWQANKNGEYQDYLRAYLYSNDKGKFRFSTEWPKLDKPHIHFIFEAPGYQKLTTQWVGDEQTNNIVLIIVLTEKDKT